MIRFDHVSKLYGDKEALSDVNMTIANGEIFGLIGIMVQEKQRRLAF